MKLQHLNHSKELADRSLQVTGNDVERHGLTRARQQLENGQAFLQRRGAIFWVCGVSHAAMFLQSAAILPVKARFRGLCSLACDPPKRVGIRLGLKSRRHRSESGSARRMLGEFAQKI